MGRAYLDEAERHFRTLGNPAMAARIRYFRASFALAAHDLETARQDLAQALDDVSGQLRASEYLWWLAERAGTLARYCGEPEQAARLYAAGVAHREAIGGPLEPVERELRAHDLAWLKANLEAEALAGAMAEGRTLSRDDVAAILWRILR
jgi:hypothetical protein